MNFGTKFSIVYGNGKFVTVGYGATKVSAVSPDGINWTQSGLPVASTYSSIAYGNGHKYPCPFMKDRTQYVNYETHTSTFNVNVIPPYCQTCSYLKGKK